MFEVISYDADTNSKTSIGVWGQEDNARLIAHMEFATGKYHGITVVDKSAQKQIVSYGDNT